MIEPIIVYCYNLTLNNIISQILFNFYIVITILKIHCNI